MKVTTGEFDWVLSRIEQDATLAELDEKEREVIDYFASDLVDMAVYLVNSWLLLQDGMITERRRELAQLYIQEHLPQVQAARQNILGAASLPLQMHTSIITIE